MEVKKLDNKLELQKDGELTLFFTGIGSAFSKRHYQTNLLIMKEDQHLLIDCGTRTPQAFFELGLPITQIKNFLITHSHADHIGGLEEVMLLRRYVIREKPHIIINETYQQILWDMSLRGGTSFNERHEGKHLTFGDMWDIGTPTWLRGFPRETYGYDLGNLNIKMFRTKHIPGTAKSWMDSAWSCGIILDDRVMFTSDTQFDPELLYQFDKIYNLEIIFHDCQFLPPGGVHASIDELKDLPDSLKAKMILVHYGDNWEKYEDKVKEYGFHSLAKQWYFYRFPLM